MYSRILVAVDGSGCSLRGAEMAMSLAKTFECDIWAAHIYDTRLHSRRLHEMEPVLPEAYQREETLTRVREAHEDLIGEGFEALSRGYMEGLLARAKRSGLRVREIHREGRNYIQLLELAREHGIELMILGAHGLADIRDGSLGSTALRVLRMAPCDVFLAQKTMPNGRILVEIDGSPEALQALKKSLDWAHCLHGSLALASVYDPGFHAHVFKTMAGTLSPQRQAQVGLSKQQALHDQLIDEGLGKLYEGFLDKARKMCEDAGVPAETRLLRGKPYRALIEQAGALDGGGPYRGGTIRPSPGKQGADRIQQRGGGEAFQM